MAGFGSICVLLPHWCTDMKDSVTTIQAVFSMVESCEEDELEHWQWMAGVRNCVEKNNWVDYLSTSSNIRQQPPLGSPGRSTRARGNADALQVPMAETPSIVTFSIIPGKLGLEDASTVKFMAQFSRPM